MKCGDWREHGVKRFFGGAGAGEVREGNLN